MTTKAYGIRNSDLRKKKKPFLHITEMVVQNLIYKYYPFFTNTNSNEGYPLSPFCVKAVKRIL
jgi:hypothetical protein